MLFLVVSGLEEEDHRGRMSCLLSVSVIAVAKQKPEQKTLRKAVSYLPLSVHRVKLTSQEPGTGEQMPTLV